MVDLVELFKWGALNHFRNVPLKMQKLDMIMVILLANVIFHYAKLISLWYFFSFSIDKSGEHLNHSQ